jgi:hypothetical protein
MHCREWVDMSSITNAHVAKLTVFGPAINLSFGGVVVTKCEA